MARTAVILIQTVRQIPTCVSRSVVYLRVYAIPLHGLREVRYYVVVE